MSAPKQKTARTGARVGLIACVSALMLAVIGISAGSAVAAPTCPSKGTNIQGKGSSLQRILQEKLTGRVASANETPALPHAALSPAQGYVKACSTGPTVSYSAYSSGAGLEAFGYKGPSSVDFAQAFVGTDDAPNSSQITAAQTAAKGAKSLVIPVAETAIAIDIHPPSGCKFKSGKGITWKDLNKVFGGNGITLWSQFENIEGTCGSAVTRVVRKEGSGTTYQFKNYLSVLEGKGGPGLPCTIEGHTKWAELEEIGAEEKPNITWPNCSGSTTLAPQAGGGAVASYVAANVGTIGYSSLADAKAKGAETALLQDQEVEGVKQYGAPGKTEGSGETAINISNCGARIYTVPTAGRVGASGESVDWSKVFGAAPTVGSSLYPLCTLTYDLSWNSYSTAGYGSNATAYKEVAKDYLANYVLGTEGQTVANNNWYQKLPNPSAAENNVLGAAQLAASKIN